MILLDTDIVTLLLRGHPSVSSRLRTVDAVAICVVTRIEVLQGRFASVLKAADGNQLLRAGELLSEAERELNQFELIEFDGRSADVFDRLRIEKQLNKIGRADLLIASIAIANRATLVTRNVRHFELVSGLKIENWAD